MQAVLYRTFTCGGTAGENEKCEDEGRFDGRPSVSATDTQSIYTLVGADVFQRLFTLLSLLMLHDFSLRRPTTALIPFRALHLLDS